MAVRAPTRARALHHFDRIDGALHAEAAPLEAIADAVGTPVYIYSTATLTRHYGLFREAVEAHRSSLGAALIAFAVKANSNLSVLATLARLGCGADTVSEGEIRRALKAGVPAQRIVFSGVGKTDAELAFAIEAGVRQINVESAVELERLIAVAASKGAAPDCSSTAPFESSARKWYRCSASRSSSAARAPRASPTARRAAARAIRLRGDTPPRASARSSSAIALAGSRPANAASACSTKSDAWTSAIPIPVCPIAVCDGTRVR